MIRSRTRASSQSHSTPCAMSVKPQVPTRDSQGTCSIRHIRLDPLRTPLSRTLQAVSPGRRPTRRAMSVARSDIVALRWYALRCLGCVVVAPTFLSVVAGADARVDHGPVCLKQAKMIKPQEGPPIMIQTRVQTLTLNCHLACLISDI